MQILIEPTEQVVRLPSGEDARVWSGRTITGIACQLLVLRVAVPDAADQGEFQAWLTEASRLRPPPDDPAF